MSEVWIVPDFAGAQHGTKENPYTAKTTGDFDGLMKGLGTVDRPLNIHLNGGTFTTVGTREWDDTNDFLLNPGFRAGRHWTFDIAADSTLKWDVDAVPDSRVDDVPLHLIMSTEARFDSRLNLHTPEEAWDLQPRGQAVRGGTIDLQFSRAVDRWRAKGRTLRIGAVALAGHQAAIEGVHVTNYGALGHEGFPLYIQGAYGQYDRNLIAQLDPATHILDADLPDDQCSHITDCVLDGYAEVDTNDQVTCCLIAGSIGAAVVGKWQQHRRAFAYQTGNKVIASDKPNLVQGHTIYQCLRGRIDENLTMGANVGAYGDFYSTKGLLIRGNNFFDCYHGIQFLLSPTGPGAEQFSHQDYVIGPNVVRSRGPNVMLDTLGPPTDRRYIRNIAVDAGLTLENNGGTGITRTGAGPTVEATSRRGCSPFGFLRS